MYIHSTYYILRICIKRSSANALSGGRCYNKPSVVIVMHTSLRESMGIVTF